jgi:hypothetical protein
MPASQIWELEFKIPDMRLDAERTFSASGHRLSLTALDANNCKGCLRFKLEYDKIDVEKAKAYGNRWVQRNLVDGYLAMKGTDLKPEMSDPVLLNEQEVGSLPKIRYVTTEIDAYLVGTLNVVDVEKSLALIDKLRSDPNKRALERSLRWLRKASHSHQVVDTFIMLWIAFNAFYGTFDPQKRGDRHAIKQLINRFPSTEKIEEILVHHDPTVRTLASRGLMDWRGQRQRSHSEDLRKLLKMERKDARRILQTIGLCLFVVRNDIFHGGMKPSHDPDFVRECSELLKRVYRESFCAYLDSP